MGSGAMAAWSGRAPVSTDDAGFRMPQTLQ